MKEKLTTWLDNIGGQVFPILRHTRELFAGADENSLSADDITVLVSRDPGLAINVMRRANTTARGHLNHRLTTIEYTVMMLGLGTIRDIALTAPVVEEAVAPKILPRILQAYGRAFQTAVYARELAVQRNDMVPDEAYLAGLLHTMSELAMWLMTPNKMRKVEALLQEQCRSIDEVQYLVFGFTQSVLSHELAKRWNMPALVVESLQPGNAAQARIRGVMLAEQMGYAYTKGCSSDDVGNCIAQIASYINAPVEEAQEGLTYVHRQWEKIALSYGDLVPEHMMIQEIQVPEDDGGLKIPAEFCLCPQVRSLARYVANLRKIITVEKAPEPEGEQEGESEQHKPHYDLTVDDMLEELVHMMHDGIGLNRVMFAIYVNEQDCLKAKFSSGVDSDVAFNQLTIPLGSYNLFSQLMAKSASIWVTRSKWENFGGMIPLSLSKINRHHSFFAQSIFVKGKPFGLFYADRRQEQCHLEKNAFARFKALASLCEQVAGKLLS
jgi:hypothetical protein